MISTTVYISTTTSILSPNLRPKRVGPSTRLVLALRRGGNDRGRGAGRIVDEGMVVLRKRIQEMKKFEKSYEASPQWMEWERSHYDEYNSMVCELMGFVQVKLMNLRPGLALGMLVLIILGMAISSAMLLIHLLEITKWISSKLYVM
ncbi:uncharacterized protein LOC116212230 [Punica granatum]|uniref:Uncharacterized protein n=2 Tax=Punica granatum TaxID=22663 RepID=A0A218XMS8_PUNGR|nr:uncharacterized protein LOC116212230 [Punica granatum]OWM86253.1 hypothetical protein CDL15_Pgr011077 [Punica granatum]PKI44294.1 hypothetical protein CRG98_035368 [Punica granatum]